MTEVATIGTTALTWAAPPKWLGALSGVVVVLGFTIVHNVFISDIWFNDGLVRDARRSQNVSSTGSFIASSLAQNRVKQAQA